MSTKLRKLLCLPPGRLALTALTSCIGILTSGVSAQAGTVTYDFTTDPTTGPNAIKVFQTGFTDSGGTSIFWKDTGGNPSGFLGVTWPLGGSSSIIVFPDIDDGKLVTSFKFETDLRVGNPQQNERAADGFSINFARSNDPVFHQDDGADPSPADFATSGAVETGTRTGIAISFDTWSGNALPDATDIEGIIVRVDNKTVLRESVPTRNGACDDTTSLQTGPRDLPYWDAARADGTLPDAAFLPASWSNLCWQKLSVEVDTNAQLTVIYKGKVILDHFQTTYFPSAGGLVLAGRTGGADEHTHFDNLKLTTTSIEADNIKPTIPANLRAIETGALRVLLANDAATDNSGRVAYEFEQDGVSLGLTSVQTTNDIRNLAPNTSYSFRVRSTDVSGNKSDWSAPLTVKTGLLVEDQIFSAVQIYGSTAEPLTGTSVDDLLFDARFPTTPDRIAPANGLQFGQPTFGDTFGDNLGYRMAGTITPPETGDYHFFLRSDDSSRLYLNKTGPVLPDVFVEVPIAEETGCCNAFREPNADGSVTQTTITPIPLVAGQRYGIVFLVKEGGGGDWGQVAFRKVGDLTAAANLPAIGYPNYISAVKPMVDPVGAVVNITQQPQSVTTVANEAVSFKVTAQTASPYSSAAIYQWFRNGSPIIGANTSTYTIPLTKTTDSGGVYNALVAVQGKSVTSSNATLTVNADNKKPTVVSARTSDTFNSVTLGFSEPITAPSATTAANYSLSGGVTVSSVTQVNPTTVRLTTSTQAPDTTYAVTLNNVADNAGNAIAAGSTAQFRSFASRPGEVRALFYTGIGGTDIASLTNNAKFPDQWDDSRFLTALNSPDGYGDNYGAMIRGYITPTNSGNYNFFIRSDDASALYLNTTSETPPNPAGATPIAEEVGCCAAFMEPGDPKTSATVALVAGKRYGFTILLKEGGGGDYVQVAMRNENNTTAADQLRPLAGAQVIGSFGPAISVDVTATNDVITAFGGTSPAAEGVARAYDNTTQKYLNFGTDNDTAAPFVGPVGVTVTPTSGATLVTGIRFYTANDAPERDPADYILEGSNDGSTFTQIAAGALSLPTARNASALALNPAQQANQLVSFNNVNAYTTYRVTFTNVRNNATANSMQIGEIELLGVAGIGGGTTPTGPTLAITRTGNTINITWTSSATLETSTTLGAGATWTAVTGATSPYPVTATDSQRFYRLRQ